MGYFKYGTLCVVRNFLVYYVNIKILLASHNTLQLQYTMPILSFVDKVWRYFPLWGAFPSSSVADLPEQWPEQPDFISRHSLRVWDDGFHYHWAPKIFMWKMLVNSLRSIAGMLVNSLRNTAGMYRLFWGNEGICDLFTEARSAEVNKHISPRCLKITYLFFTLRGRVNESE